MEIVYKILKILSNRNTSLYIYIYIKIYWERGGPGPKEGKDNNEIIDLSISLKKKSSPRNGRDRKGSPRWRKRNPIG